MKVQTRGRVGVWLVCLVLSSWGVGGAAAATLVLDPVDTVGDGMMASRTTGGGFSATNPTATTTATPSPSDPLTYAVPRSPVTLTFFNYGAPVARNPALICLGAAENDFWEHAAAGPGGGGRLDREVGRTLEYRFRRVHLTVVPVGGVRGLRWRSIRPMVLGLRYFVDTYGAMDMLFDIRVEGMGTGRVGTGRLTTV